MSESAMVPTITFLLYKVRTYFQVMAEIALFTIGASSIHLKFIAGLDLAFIMRVFARISLSALTMDEFLAYTIRRQLKCIVMRSIALRLNRLCHVLINTVERPVHLWLSLVVASIHSLSRIMVNAALLSIVV